MPLPAIFCTPPTAKPDEFISNHLPAIQKPFSLLPVSAPLSDRESFSGFSAGIASLLCRLIRQFPVVPFLLCKVCRMRVMRRTTDRTRLTIRKIRATAVRPDMPFACGHKKPAIFPQPPVSHADSCCALLSFYLSDADGQAPSAPRLAAAFYHSVPSASLPVSPASCRDPNSCFCA